MTVVIYQYNYISKILIEILHTFFFYAEGTGSFTDKVKINILCEWPYKGLETSTSILSFQVVNEPMPFMCY